MAKERITTVPEWFDGKKINEVQFCQEFLEEHPMKCIQENGSLKKRIKW